MSTFDTEIKIIADKTDQYLKTYFSKQKQNNQLYDAMGYGLFAGGKKIRSYLTVAAFDLFEIKEEAAIAVAAAIECVHSYSLIHDDLPSMDNDDFRRGKESTHKKFGESTAILAGNSLLTIAFEILTSDHLNLDKEVKSDLVFALASGSGHLGIAGGQFLDLSFEGKAQNEQTIIDMQNKKTGELMGFCTEAAAIVAKKKEDREELKKIGLDIGLLFQIADDLLDVYGDQDKLGKPSKQDDKKGKATLISTFGMEKTNVMANQLLNKIKKSLEKYGSKADRLLSSAEFILKRDH
jgi:farnesyl diphosphate synthase|tara:strand:- start:380 stop:1261 length:882 start_codon:yes stop_codon:yes gene_type:complete